jgi:hypothetical protein
MSIPSLMSTFFSSRSFLGPFCLATHAGLEIPKVQNRRGAFFFSFSRRWDFSPSPERLRHILYHSFPLLTRQCHIFPTNVHALRSRHRDTPPYHPSPEPEPSSRLPPVHHALAYTPPTTISTRSPLGAQAGSQRQSSSGRDSWPSRACRLAWCCRELGTTKIIFSSTYRGILALLEEGKIPSFEMIHDDVAQ